MIENKSEKSRQTQQDPRRLIATTHCTADGEVAEKNVMSLDTAAIEKEQEMDGLNCLATKLEDSIGEILHVNGFRYEIEHLFRVTKTEFDASATGRSHPSPFCHLLCGVAAFEGLSNATQ